MDETIKQILENQEAILAGVSALLTPHCKGVMDVNGETWTNVKMIDCYHKSRKFLGNE